jgi:hypothetical protein
MPETLSGSCYGYGVRSRIPLRSLRSGGGDPLYVSEGAVAEPGPGQSPLIDRMRDGKPFLRLYAADAGYLVWIAGVGWFGVDTSVPAITVPLTSSGPIRETRLWGLPSALCYIARGDQSLHGAAVDVGGAAILLAAPRRFGKTTFAAAFVQAGHRLLSEDLSCCSAGNVPAVLPGPALLRVRHDVFRELALPNAAAVAQDDDRVYVAVDDSLRGDGAAVPLRAIVFLREADAPPRLERVAPERALPDLWTLAFRLPTESDAARCFGALTALAENVPIWNLHRRLVLADLPAAVEAVCSTCV